MLYQSHTSERIQKKLLLDENQNRSEIEIDQTRKASMRTRQTNRTEGKIEFSRII
jgi:hypothetical protein